MSLLSVDSSDYTSVPLHNVYLSSNIVSGLVTLGIRSSLPFDGVHLLLRNDLAGDKVVVSPVIYDKPCFDQVPNPIESEHPGLYPSCAVTRAMSRKKALEENTSSEVDLSETFFSQVFKVDEGFKPSEGSLSKESLIKEQHKDPEISCLFQKAVDESEISKNPVCYFVENDVLMRKWRPPDVPAEDKWTVKYQVVIPKAYWWRYLAQPMKQRLLDILG